MKRIGKLLGGVATAAALAALIPYTSDYDAETDTQKTHALLWTLTSKPNPEGKRSYHFPAAAGLHRGNTVDAVIGGNANTQQCPIPVNKIGIASSQ